MNLTIKSSNIGQRIDLFLMNYFPEISRTTLKKACMSGIFLVNSDEIASNYRLKEKDIVSYSEKKLQTYFSSEDNHTLKATEMKLDILFEDRHTLVLNKPSGINVHPVLKNNTNTLLNGAIYYVSMQSSFNENKRIRLIHRLDKDTSGVILLSKSLQANDFYSEQFQKRTVEKKYLALVAGNVNKVFESSTISVHTNIVKEKDGIAYKNTTSAAGKPSSTVFSLLSGEKNIYLVQAIPKTGRTHQIRVHLAGLNLPIVGDRIYGGMKANRLMLHAHTLRFTSFETKEEMTVEARLPKDFTM